MPIYRRIGSSPTPATPVATPPPGWTPPPIRRRLPRPAPVPATPIVQDPPVAHYGNTVLTKRNVELEVVDTIENRMIAVPFGEVRYSPAIAYLKCTGTNLEVVYVLGEGPIGGVDKVWLYQDEIYPATVSWCSVSIVTGTLSQAELTTPSDSNWASAFPGYALLALNISLLNEDYEGAGMPDVTVHVRGRQCFDPRVGYSAYTTNPVLIARDILTNPDYGLGISPAEIDDTSVGTAADACDTLISGVKTYEIGYVLTDRAEAAGLLDEIMVACSGRWGWWDGKYHFSIDVGSGSSSATINDDGAGSGYPILGNSDGTSTLRCYSRRDDAPNACSVTYCDPADWTATVPQRQREVRYETANVSKGSEQPRELRLTTIPVRKADQAYRLAKQAVLLSQRRRHGVTLAQHGMMLVPGDLVTLNSAIGPVSSQVCRVNGILDNQDGTVELELIEYSASDYSTDTYTTDTATPPTSVASGEFLKYVDDFTTGGTADGAVGELGWSIETGYTSLSLSYSTEANHPGMLLLTHGYAGAGGDSSIYATTDSWKYATNSTWSARALWRMNSGYGSTGTCCYVDLGTGRYFRYYNDSGTHRLQYYNGSGYDNLQTITYSDWINVAASCDGAGTVTHVCEVGANRYTYTQAVSGSTLIAPAAFGSCIDPGSSIAWWIDLISWVQQAVR